MENVEIDLEEMKKNEDMLNESFLRMYGTVIELILKQMFGIPVFGSSSSIKPLSTSRAMAIVSGILPELNTTFIVVTS